MKTVFLTYAFNFPNDKSDEECRDESQRSMNEPELVMARPEPQITIETQSERFQSRPEFLPR